MGSSTSHNFTGLRSLLWGYKKNLAIDVIIIIEDDFFILIFVGQSKRMANDETDQ
jgi:hypothetical protein